MHDNAEIAYRRVLGAHPELATGLADAAAALPMPPLESLFLTGGIPLGAYCPGESDVDLVAIVSEPFCEAELRETVRSVWAALPNASLMLIQRANLSEDEPEALAVWDPGHVTSYSFHAMDVILLRDHSVLLRGTDCRHELPTYQPREVIGDTIAHVANNMLPPIITAIKANPSLPPEAYAAVAMVMLRCLFTLRTGRVLSKQQAAQWLTAEAGIPPALRRLAEVTAQQGCGPAMTVDEQNGLFTEAAAEFGHLVSDAILPDPGRSD